MRMSVLKALQILAIVLMCFCFFVWGRYSAPVNECKDEYKEAYMNHIGLCDTLHERCFRIKEK